MFFESLNSLWLLLLAIPLIIFYFLKLKRARMRIPSLFLWSQVINDSRVNSPFQKFKRHILLLLQLLILGLLAFSSARPFLSGTPSKETLIPVIIDNSASMAAIDEATGKSRLDIAKEKVRSLVQGKGENQKIALITAGKTATKRLDFTDNSRVILDALSQIQPDDLPSNMEDAFRMAHAMSREHGFSEILLFSDGNFDPKSSFNLPFRISYRKIGGPAQNAGITGLNARMVGENTWAVFAEISRNNPNMPLRMEFSIDGRPAHTELVPAGAETEKISFETAGESEHRIDARISSDSFDSLASDNSASLDLPLIRPITAYVPESISSIASSLGAIEGLRLSDSPTGNIDLIVADKEEDVKASCRTVLTSGFVPAELRDIISIGNKPSSVVDWKNYDPLLQYAQLAEIITSQNPILKGDDSDIEKRGYETVVFGREGPLILKRSWGGGVSYHFLFDIERSTIPYRVAFPVMMMNLANIARTQAGISDASAAPTGILPEIDLDPDSDCEIRTPDSRTVTERTGPSGKLPGIPAPRAGKYSIFQNGEKRAEVFAALLDRNETMLAGMDKIEFGELSVQSEQKTIKAPRPIWKILAAAALIFLFIEWWVFNRPPPGIRTASKILPLILAALILPQSLSARTGERTAPQNYLHFNIIPLHIFIRTDSPIPAELILDLKGGKAVSGKLEILFLDGGNSIAKITTDEITAVEGTQRRRILLPPMTSSTGSPVTAAGTWISEDSRFGLGSVPVNLPSNIVRQLCIGFCKPDNFVQADSLEMAKSLRPENFVPDLEKLKKKPDAVDLTGNKIESETPSAPANSGTSGANFTNVKSGVAGIPSSSFPASPEACCAYDILILDSEGFSYLGEKQLDALARWILGGGAACIRPGEAVCNDAHLEFFRRLAICCTNGEIRVRQSPQGQLIFDAEDGEDVQLFKAGLGRLAILNRKFRTTDDFSSPAWRSVAGFLWRTRNSQYFVASGKFFDPENKLLKTAQDEEGTTIRSWGNTRLTLPDDLVFPQSALGNYGRINSNWSYAQLSPWTENKAKEPMIPPWFICSVIVAFALVAGPLDYFILGRMKRRRLTWIVFPLASIAFAAGTKIYSDMRLGRFDRTFTLNIYDIGADNSVLLHQKYVAVTPGRTKEFAFNCRNELWIPPQDFEYHGRNASVGMPSQCLSGTPYTGYTASFLASQWTRNVAKTFSFGAPADFKDPNWKFPDRLSVESLWDMVGAITLPLEGTSAKFAVFKIHPDRSYGKLELISSSAGANAEDGNLDRFLTLLDQGSTYDSRYLKSGSSITRLSPWMSDVSITPPCDASAGGEVAVFAIVAREDIIDIYRRAYSAADK